MTAAILWTVLCSAQASSVLLVDWAQLGNEAALYSTVQDIDGCVGVWKLYLRQKMCLRIYLWIFLSIDDNSWKQLLTPTTFYWFAPSNSKCKHDKKEPLANRSKSCCLNRPFQIARHLLGVAFGLTGWLSGCCLNQKFQDSYCNDSDYLSDHMNFNWSFSKPLLWHAFKCF